MRLGDAEQELKLGFEKGMLESVEPSLVPVGYAISLLNWVPEPTGGLRVRRGFQEASGIGGAPLPDPKIIVGIGSHAVSATGASYHAVINASGASYTLWVIPTSELTFGSWSLVDTISVGGTSPVAFASGLGVMVYTNHNWSAARSWDTTTAQPIPGAPAGRALAFHKNRFFIAGTAVNPSRLWFSDIGSHSSWPSTNYIDIQQEDGEAILDIAPFEDGVLIAKASSLHFMSGSDPANFAIHKLNSGGGYPGRCICPTPYGALIASTEAIYLWTGGGVDYISKPVEATYGMTGAFVSTTYLDGVAYICDRKVTGASAFMHCIALSDGNWWRENHSSTTDGTGFISSWRNRMLVGPQAGTRPRMLQYRDIPKGTRSKDAGTSTSQSFFATTPEYWIGGPNKASTPRHLYLRYRQRSGTSTMAPFYVRPFYDGIGQASVPIAMNTLAGNAQATYRVRLDIGSRKGAYIVQFVFSHDPGVSDTALVDLEELVFTYNAEDVR